MTGLPGSADNGNRRSAAWSRWITVAKYAIAVLVLGYIARQLVHDWSRVRALDFRFVWHPGWVVASLLVTWAMYAALVEGWRALVVGWHERLHWPVAFRIWILSSLGKYVPGKVWAIAGAAVLSERAGVRAPIALAAAVLMQVLAVGTGVAVAAVTVGPALVASTPGAAEGMTVLGVLAAVTLLVLAHRRLGETVWRLGRLKGPPPGPVEVVPLGKGIVLNVVAWLGYGLAFWMLAKGVLPEPSLDYRVAAGAFAASYLAGFLAPFAPAGLGVRELLLLTLLEGQLGYGQAAALAVASRLTLTVAELGAAVPFLRMKGSIRDRS